ncbi:translational repressor of GCN4 [Metschnikowia bicuspidata]|uniref:tRNA (adenine(58)-N(1))-methyltransferase catalytic subunit TRM61 n=1 Tax=Metschnikowia bicuspidata TaxID=27322 RepID=A0A4P9ZA63_9ASCO|nr:translational repressor of GCN4 [Metschnikowia bicuspidata]
MSTMSFYAYKDIIEEGDLVLAFVSRGVIKPITVTCGEVLNTRYGSFDHSLMIGMRYGSQMGGIRDKGFVHLLHPMPELWTVSLPHRTQIVYTPDSSYIVQRLGITAGLRVIEAGTGSASFTHAFARTLGKEGRLFTYEFHEPRFLEARRELDEHGLLQTNCVIKHRNVCSDGFEIADPPVGFACDGSLCCDAVFLDLPAPWTAISHLPPVLASDRRVGICCFSPCIEQVEKTIEALDVHGWTDIEMVEIAGRRWEARQEMVRDVNDVIGRLKQIQGKKTQGIESKRLGQLDDGDGKARGETASPDLGGDKKRSTEQLDSSALPEPVEKEHRFNPFGKGTRIREGDEKYTWKQVTKVESEIKTHTSYLTFAYLVPPKREH